MVIKKDVLDKLLELSRMGCAMECADLKFRAVAAGPVWADGDSVYWCELQAQSQSGVHFVEVVRAKIHHNRDVSLWSADGNSWYVAPVDECPNIDPSNWRESWTAYKAATKTPTGKENVRVFMQSAIGSSPPDTVFPI